MSQPFETPQEAEDAFYDALDERNVELMLRVWDDSDDIACLLPMQPFVHGREVREMMRALLDSDVRIDLAVHHVRWVELGDIAIHYVEEQNSAGALQPPGPGGDGGLPAGLPTGRTPALLATNVFRRRGDGWTMILHQNAPPPPPSNPPR